MDKPSRWIKLVKNLRFIHIPFKLINKIIIVDRTGHERSGKNQDDFKRIIEEVRDSNEQVQSVHIETNNRKMKALVKAYTDEIFSKYFK